MEKDKKNNADMMGSMPIGRLIMKMSLPIMLSMLIQALYNIVDSIFVSWISEEALTAVSLAFPLQNLMIAFAVGTAVGIQSLLSRKLGEQDKQEAEKAQRNGVFLALMTWVVFALAGITLSRTFLKMFTSDAHLLDLSTVYCQICLALSIGVFLSITLERLMQSHGDSFHSMITQAVGAVINIVLDPILIFTFKMGIVGAAIATVFGQWVSCALGIYFLKKHSGVIVSMKGFRPNGKTIGQIYQVGVPVIVTNSLTTVMISAINAILITFSTTAVSVFGIYGKLQSFVFMPIFGLSAGIVPIIAYNYGAKLRHRITETVGKGVLISFCFMATGWLIFQLFPEYLLAAFNATDEMLEIGVPALRTISWSFLTASISIATSASFQGTGFGIYALIHGIVRQLVVLIPSSLLLSRWIGLRGVWFGFIISDFVGLILTGIFYADIYKRKIKPLSD